jgi:hypothetical protein
MTTSHGNRTTIREERMTASRSVTRFQDLDDVDAAAIADGKIPQYDAASGKHKYATGGSLAAFGATIMGCGDSIIANGWSGSRPNYAVDGRAILAWATLYSQGKLTLYGDTTTGPAAGTGGFTTAQILATEVPIIVSKKPMFCVVIAGANDFANSVAFSTTIANYKSILDTLRAAGVIRL